MQRSANRGILFIFAVVLIACLTTGAQQPNRPGTIEAQRIVLKDSEGRDRAILSAESKGSVKLEMLKPSGAKGIIISLGDKSSGLTLKGNKQDCAISLSVDEDVPQVSFWDKNGIPRILMHLQDNANGKSSPTLSLELGNGRDPHTLLTMSINLDGIPFLRYFTKKGEKLIEGPN